MNLKTVTYDVDTWQIAPKVATDKMAGISYDPDTARGLYQAMLAEAPQPPELSPWLPIESAPKDGEQFYVTGYNYGVVGAEMWHDVAFRNKKGGITSATTHDFLQFAAYWMPLPPAPKPEQGK